MKTRRHETMAHKDGSFDRAQPALHQRAPETQPFEKVMDEVPIALDREAREGSVRQLNQILADTMTLRDLYKKSHWQVSGPTFYQLHLLFDKHYEEQTKLVDKIAERIQLLGGISVAMAADVAEMTRIARPPRGREEVPVQISRLLEAHEQIMQEVRDSAGQAEDSGDPGTNDLLVSQVLRRNELQAWFLYEHLVAMPLVHAQ
ncbi:MAG TPA: DNA starvation/stationary phase protection protein [Verrucomicrobiae bacterium]|nr:DNA starvation/stationary phase protection protein [Verrucomicrobiae bacterium]